MRALLGQAARFGMVGLVATGVHFCLALLLIHFSVTPLIANLGAFIGAFSISYLGHVHWSFRDQDHDKKQSLSRFLTISIGGFIANEILFAVLLQSTHLPPGIALAIVLTVVAGSTFILSRNWAFKTS
ncbi:GtrA family protein, partial [Akkermansiaceae bacterium]|nr:GtrA family protein [Akkermansiaceae bacterium]